MDKELLEKAAKAAGWTWWRSKHGYWNLTAPDRTQHTACHGWTKFDPHTGEELADSTPGDALLEVGFCPLYTTPPRREWVGLTDEEIALVCGECAASAHRTDDISYARAIEAKLREKNAQPSKPLTLGQKQRLWSSLGSKPTLKDRVNAFGLAIEAAHGIKGNA